MRAPATKKEFTGKEAATIDRSAVDALLHGMTDGMVFLGRDKEPLLDEMGKYMLDYLVKTGTNDVKKNLITSVGKMLERNGFGDHPNIRFDKSGLLSAPGFVTYLAETSGTQEGSGVSRVDWKLYEMILYGMTKGLDFLGAQGQMIINRIGAGMLDYLVQTKRIKPTANPDLLIERALAYFVGAGFAMKIEGKRKRGQPYLLEFTYFRSRYHINVLKRLRNEGSVLYSCPPCIIACSIKQSQGWKIRFDIGLEILGGGEVILRHRFYSDKESFSDAMAKKVSRMMEA